MSLFWAELELCTFPPPAPSPRSGHFQNSVNIIQSKTALYGLRALPGIQPGLVSSQPAWKWASRQDDRSKEMELEGLCDIGFRFMSGQLLACINCTMYTYMYKFKQCVFEIGVFWTPWCPRWSWIQRQYRDSRFKIQKVYWQQAPIRTTKQTCFCRSKLAFVTLFVINPEEHQSSEELTVQQQVQWLRLSVMLVAANTISTFEIALRFQHFWKHWNATSIT